LARERKRERERERVQATVESHFLVIAGDQDVEWPKAKEN
jgi:hypothetical protein